MANVTELKEVRLQKINLLKQSGIDPYPVSVYRSHYISDLIENFEFLSKSNETVSIIGRVMSMRGQGALIFIDLYDGTGRFQALLKKDEEIKVEISETKKNNSINGFNFFNEVVDEGDFVKVEGNVFETKRGQKTVSVKSWQMIAKSLRPIPDEFYGLKDEDEKYRRRYLDILLNPETKKTFEQKSIFWNSFRDFLLNRNFVEVQTPVLETITGGADARPFITHHNALDIDVYLRISCGELWQKKLLVSGMPKVFEIGRIFRNEGMSNEHLQDYTQIEFYEAFSDYKKGMEMVKELYRYVANKTFQTTKFNIDGHDIDLNDEWGVINFVDTLKERFDIDVLTADIESIKDILNENNINYEQNINKEKATDELWKSIRNEFIGPSFLIGVPVFLEPLAKKDPNSPLVVERFQVILGGSEMGKGFSELNDPIDQSERFSHQDKMREFGDEEAQMNDNEYVEAMEYGMPPAFGFGISERLFSVLKGKSVRETTIFPLMRPKD